LAQALKKSYTLKKAKSLAWLQRQFSENKGFYRLCGFAVSFAVWQKNS
jgi:hypothetical protein